MKITDKRNRYYHKIYVYQQRRSKLRAKFGVKDNKSPKNVPQEYRDAVLNINNKIRTWNRQINRIDAVTQKLSAIESAVVNFVGTKIRNINGQNLPHEVTLAKGIYFKYALENGLQGVDAKRFIGGSKHDGQALAYRKRFTNSFKSNPENREKWNQFKEFYNQTCKVA